MGCPARLNVAASASSGRSRRREELMPARRVVILMALCVVSGRCMFAPPLILRLSLLQGEPARRGRATPAISADTRGARGLSQVIPAGAHGCAPITAEL